MMRAEVEVDDWSLKNYSAMTWATTLQPLGSAWILASRMLRKMMQSK